ncbi:MAG TPA: UPF0149 family protein [Rhodocyclaceae bacterium]|nr:UPF0149 family protein [Rhodocyclaceae bacterium]
MNVPFSEAGPLGEAEFDALDALLRRFPESHSLEELDGLLCALIINPTDVGLDQWLPLALGVDELHFETDEQRHRTLELMRRHWNTIASGLRETWSGVTAAEGANAMYFPLLDDPATSGHPLAEGWARGFRAGLDWLDDIHWDALEEDEECVALLSLIAAFDSGEKSPGQRLTDEERDELVSVAAAGLQYLYAFWRRWVRVMDAPKEPFHATETPGRNDVCICGSGKKFKKCCGAPEKMH